MASIEFTARRAAFACAVAIATIAAPALAVFAGSSAAITPRIVAAPGDCETSTTPGDASLNCSPGEVPDIGAPSEEELTEDNPGVNSPARPHR